MADVGVIVRGDLLPGPGARPPLVIVESAARPLAATIAIGQAQRTLNERLPDVTLARILAQARQTGAMSAEEYDFVSGALARRPGSGGPAPALGPVVERRQAEGGGGARNGNVLYYAGAVSAVFMLFAAMHGALTLVDERSGGIAERLRIGRGGMAAVVGGKFLFLAGAGHRSDDPGVPYRGARLPGHLPRSTGSRLWLGACALSAMAAAGSPFSRRLCVAAGGRRRRPRPSSSCSSRPWGEHDPALPDAALAAGALLSTPNAWMIRAFDLATRPAAAAADIRLAWAVLAGLAIAGGAGAILVAARARPFAAVA